MVWLKDHFAESEDSNPLLKSVNYVRLVTFWALPKSPTNLLLFFVTNQLFLNFFSES